MHNSNFSSSNGSTEDLFRDSIDSCDNDITEKVDPEWCRRKGLNVCLLLEAVRSTLGCHLRLERFCSCPGRGWGTGLRLPLP